MRCEQRQWDVNKRQCDVDKHNEMWTKTMRCKPLFTSHWKTMRCEQRQWNVNKDSEMWTKTMRCEQRQWDINKDNEM